MKALRLIMQFLAAAALLLSLSAFAESTLEVTPTPLASGDDPGFRCAFQRVGGKDFESVILWADDDVKLPRRAAITINGKRMILAPKGIEHRDKSKDKVSVGDLLVLHFAGNGVRVTTRATVTWACPEDNDSCEVTRYRAKISVASGSASTSIDAEGECEW